MCDRARMDQALERLSVLGEARQRMLIQWIARHGRAMQAILEGDLATAEQHAESALELGRRTLGDQVEGIYGIQMFTIRRSEEHTSELQSLMRISYAVFCLKKKNTTTKTQQQKTCAL